MTSGLSIPRFQGVSLEQYFGLWAVDAGRFLQIVGALQGYDFGLHIRQNQDRDLMKEDRRRAQAQAVSPGQTRKTRVGIISLDGPMMKRVSSLSDGASTLALRKAVRDASLNEDLDAILLKIDSPGGTVAGTADLAGEVLSAREKKPVWAFVEDTAASAAYWIASQAERVYANNPTALIGSIGTYVGLYDASRRAEMLGVRPVVIASKGAETFKGAGFPGVEITPEQKAEWQALVDKTQDEFTEAVRTGRALTAEKAQALADGRIHMARDAQTLGLLDGIASFDEVLDELAMETQAPYERASQEDRTLWNKVKTFMSAGVPLAVNATAPLAGITAGPVTEDEPPVTEPDEDEEDVDEGNDPDDGDDGNPDDYDAASREDALRAREEALQRREAALQAAVAARTEEDARAFVASLVDKEGRLEAKYRADAEALLVHLEASDTLIRVHTADGFQMKRTAEVMRTILSDQKPRVPLKEIAKNTLPAPEPDMDEAHAFAEALNKVRDEEAAKGNPITVAQASALLKRRNGHS